MQSRGRQNDATRVAASCRSHSIIEPERRRVCGGRPAATRLDTVRLRVQVAHLLTRGEGGRETERSHRRCRHAALDVDASHEDQAHEVPRMARIVPLLSTIGVLRLFGVSFGQRIESLAPSVRQFARATSFRAAGYKAAADEIIHIWESASEVRRSRRRLTIPVLVITGGRGADENWRRLQRDQASLSDRGCLIVAQDSGHVVSVDQPEVVVDAIRTVVETARGHDVPLCATPANVERDRPRQ